MEAGIGTLSAGGELESDIRLTIDEAVSYVDESDLGNREVGCARYDTAKSSRLPVHWGLRVTGHFHDIELIIVTKTRMDCEPPFIFECICLQKDSETRMRFPCLNSTLAAQ